MELSRMALVPPRSTRDFPALSSCMATCFPLTQLFSRITGESAPLFPPPASCLSACFLPPPSVRCQITPPVFAHQLTQRLRRLPVSANAHRHDLSARGRVLFRRHGQVQLCRDVAIQLRLQRARVLRDSDGIQGQAGAVATRPTCWVKTASSRMTRCDRHARHPAPTR